MGAGSIYQTLKFQPRRKTMESREVLSNEGVTQSQPNNAVLDLPETLADDVGAIVHQAFYKSLEFLEK